MYVEGDVPNVVNGNCGNGGFGGFGDGWAAIILFALIFGWGRNGNGFGGGNGGVGENYVLATDFATIERKLDGVNNGICSLGFDLQGNLCNGFANTIASINSNGYETRTAISGLSSQLANCCCETKSAIADVKYANAINTRDLIENQNANYRALHDEIVANRIEDKNAQITAQQNEINALRLAASQCRQNEYLVDKLAPKFPVPAFLTCNPFTGQTYNGGNCNCNCGL